MKTNSKHRKFSLDRYTFFLFTVPPLILYSFFFVYSVFVGVRYSFTDWNGISREYGFNGLSNYDNLLHNSRFWNSMRVTVVYALLLLICVISVSLILALCLNSLKHMQAFSKSVFFFPAMISSVSIALIWDQLYYRVVPIIGKLLGIAALSQSPLANPKTALPAIVFVNAWQAVAMPTLIFLAGLQTIPEELFESAKIDGATPWNRFRYITLPFLLPTITINVVLTIKQGLTTFDFPLAMTMGGPASASEVIGILIYLDAFQNMRFSIANAEAMVLFVIIAVLSFIQIKMTSGKGAT